MFREMFTEAIEDRLPVLVEAAIARDPRRAVGEALNEAKAKRMMAQLSKSLPLNERYDIATGFMGAALNTAVAAQPRTHRRGEGHRKRTGGARRLTACPSCAHRESPAARRALARA
jgi:hypothetical protein